MTHIMPADTAPFDRDPVLSIGGQPRGERTALHSIRRALGYATMLLAALAFLYPLFWMVMSSFKPGASILNDPLNFNPFDATLRNWSAMFDNVPIVHALLNTAIVVILKGGVLLVFSPLAGYGFAKFNFPFKNALFG